MRSKWFRILGASDSKLGRGPSWDWGGARALRMSCLLSCLSCICVAVGVLSRSECQWPKTAVKTQTLLQEPDNVI